MRKSFLSMMVAVLFSTISFNAIGEEEVSVNKNLFVSTIIKVNNVSVVQECYMLDRENGLLSFVQFSSCQFHALDIAAGRADSNSLHTVVASMYEENRPLALFTIEYKGNSLAEFCYNGITKASDASLCHQSVLKGDNVIVLTADIAGDSCGDIMTEREMQMIENFTDRMFDSVERILPVIKSKSE